MRSGERWADSLESRGGFAARCRSLVLTKGAAQKGKSLVADRRGDVCARLELLDLGFGALDGTIDPTGRIGLGFRGFARLSGRSVLGRGRR